ncbi:hypothetical protein [Streptomyces sp. 5-10]|uniref:hypothetical protein n=1 Tax=Streptomyces sp. 5-10 TaxID=878925 RepID=UPI00168A5D9A|nr:hypothetical protein [Streptomyces sp. 5-10]MBD3004680.1 hypothetical protein [Streptomyces sp. 5-10]
MTQNEDKGAGVVPSPVGQHHIAIEEAAQELTQAKRRLQRAAWAAKIENRDSPLARDLEKIYFAVENLQVTYDLKDQEISD